MPVYICRTYLCLFARKTAQVRNQTPLGIACWFAMFGWVNQGPDFCLHLLICYPYLNLAFFPLLLF